MAPRITEFDIQRALCLWLDGHQNALPALRADAIYFHVPNGGARDAREGARFKQIGVKPGVPDMLFLCQQRTFGLELKAPGGAQSPAQIAMAGRFAAAGIAYAVVDSLAAAKAQVIAWGLTNC